MSATIASSETALTRILNSKNLPTLPVIASKLLVLTAEEDATLTGIAELIAQDMALSAKVLRVANSSFYSFPQQIGTINQAVSILGINAVRSLVLSFSFLTIGKQQKNSSFDLQQFWERSLVEAVGTKLIIEQTNDSDPEEAFTGGLLQNIGYLILAVTMPTEYSAYQEQSSKLTSDKNGGPSQAALLDLERQHFGITHPEAGYAVAQSWGLPETLLLPIRWHHEPLNAKVTSARGKHIIRATYLADTLSHLFYSEWPEQYHKQFRSDAKQLLGLKVLSVNTILKLIDKIISQSAEYFGIKISNIKSVAEILQEANLRLSLINLSYEEMNRELIKSKIELERLTEELAQKNKLLENMANIDGLTEINNHRFFQNFLDSEISRSIRNNKPLSLCLADIDFFKKFNDTYGHQTGDFILKEFCRICKEVIREYDLVARYGGEEFAFVLPETDLQAALVVAEKIRKTIEEYSFNDGVHSYNVTISIGVTTALPLSNEFSKNDFINQADTALYEAKNSGRNRVAVADSKKKKKWFAF